MRRRARFALGLACAVACAVCSPACTTDVSSVASLGTQGRVLTGIPVPPNKSTAQLALPRAIAAGADGVFWTTGQILEYCPSRGCDAASTPDFHSPMIGSPALVVVDDRNVYWTEYVDDPPKGAVLSLPQGAAAADPPTTVYEEVGEVIATDTNGLDVGFLAVDGGRVYWGSVTSSGVRKLNSCATTGCASPVSVALPPLARAMAVQGGVLYFAQPSTSGASLSACPASPPIGSASAACGGATVTVLADASYGVSTVGRVQVDGGNVYFEASMASPPKVPGVYACAVPACAGGPRLLYPDASGFQAVAMAVRGGQVYAAVAKGLGTCLSTSCPNGPQPVDLLFSGLEFPESEPPSSVVASATGAYAYAKLVAPSGGSSLLNPPNTPIAMVYLPTPGR